MICIKTWSNNHPILALLTKIKEEVVHIDCWLICVWQIRWRTDNHSRSVHSRRSCQKLMESTYRSSSCTFCLWEWSCWYFQRKRQHGWWWDIRRHSSQLGWITTEGQCDKHEGIFKQSLYCFSGVPLSQWQAESSLVCVILG